MKANAVRKGRRGGREKVKLRFCKTEYDEIKRSDLSVHAKRGINKMRERKQKERRKDQTLQVHIDI